MYIPIVPIETMPIAAPNAMNAASAPGLGSRRYAAGTRPYTPKAPTNHRSPTLRNWRTGGRVSRTDVTLPLWTLEADGTARESMQLDVRGSRHRGDRLWDDVLQDAFVDVDDAALFEM